MGGAYNPCRVYEKCIQNLFWKTLSLQMSKHKTGDNIKMYLKKDFPRWEIISSLLFDFSRITVHHGINKQIQK